MVELALSGTGASELIHACKRVLNACSRAVCFLWSQKDSEDLADSKQTELGKMPVLCSMETKDVCVIFLDTSTCLTCDRKPPEAITFLYKRCSFGCGFG